MRLGAALAAAALTAAGWAAAPAAAGTYTVYACTAAGHKWGNRSWTVKAARNIVTDRECDTGALIGIRVDAGKTIPSGTSAGLTFTSPPGTSIVGFSFDRQLDYKDAAASGTHQLYTLYQLGSTVFAGAGDYNDATRSALNAQHSWYGYPAKEAHLARGPASLAGFGALRGYRGGARQLFLRVGCYPRGGTACSVGSGGRIYNVFYGAAVTIDDPTPPSTMSVEASGLLAGGQRDGADPVTVSSTDNTGIRSVQIVDVTGAPRVVGAESYDVGPTLEPGDQRTDRGQTCSYRLVHTCPNLNRETLRATSLQPGRRLLVVRVIDAGGNVAQRGPYTVDVVSPSDRGPLNGSGATETGTIRVAFKGHRRSRLTVRYGKRQRIRGRLLNAAGAPVSGARIDVVTRDERRGADPVVRGAVTTSSDGSFRYRARAAASRRIQFGWRAHVNDVRFAANAYLSLRARASARLRAAPHRVRVGHTVKLSGRLRGTSRGGVTVILQGRARGRRFQTFADAVTGRSGRFHVRYRFRDSASAGRTFVFRTRIRPGPRFPYETGYSNRVKVRVT